MKMGILGLGEGRSAISAALSSTNFELRIICDLDEDLCRKRAEEFNLSKYTTRYKDLLEDDEIDVIAIYTPDHLHATHIRLALENDKHVICTKPFIDRLDDAGKLLELYNRTGKRVMVGQSSRFFEPMIRQRGDFEDGVVGNLITVEAYYNADHRWFLKKEWARKSEFHWLLGGLSHPVDLVRWYMPDIEEVTGYGLVSENGKKLGLEHEDTMHFIMRATDGRIARVSGSYSGPVQPSVRDSEMSCILRGTDGCSQADYKELRYSVTDKTGEEKQIFFEEKAGHFFRFEGKTHHAGEYQNYFDYFAECIRNGRIPEPDLVEGIHTVALMMAMDRSLKEKRPVRPEDVLNEYDLK